MLCFVFGLCLLPSFVVPTPETSFQPVHEWKQLEFEYQSEAARQADIASGAWIPSIPAPIDVDIHYSSNNPGNAINSLNRHLFYRRFRSFQRRLEAIACSSRFQGSKPASQWRSGPLRTRRAMGTELFDLTRHGTGRRTWPAVRRIALCPSIEFM